MGPAKENPVSRWQAPIENVSRQKSAHMMGWHRCQRAVGVGRFIPAASGHGQDAFTVAMEHVQAQFAARSSDAVSTFLWSAHRSSTGRIVVERMRYEDHKEFNSFLECFSEANLKEMEILQILQ